MSSEAREEIAVYVIHQVGVDQLRLVLALSGESARLCEVLTEHDWRPRGMPNMRFVGRVRQNGFKREFDHFLDGGEKLMYHRASAGLHVDIHYNPLASVSAGVAHAEEVVEELAAKGLASLFPARIARVDVTGDVVFRSAAYFRYVASAFRAMVCERGRAVEPYRSSTLYLNASKASKTKRLGRIYDKGLERTERAGWNFPTERYMRIEAEQVWEQERPLLASLTPDEAQRIFLDRFGAVGHGTLVLKPGLVDALMTLLRDGAIKPQDYEKLYAFLDHCRMGLVEELYADSRDTYHRRARVARSLGLDIPGLEPEPAEVLAPALDVRALVREIAARLSLERATTGGSTGPAEERARDRAA